jgi:hypothetical protein
LQKVEEETEMSHLLSKQKNDDIEKQRLKLLYKSSEILSISNIVSALMAYAIVFHHYHLLWIELWVLGVVFLNAAQIALARYFFKISENDFDVLKYEYIFIAVAILNGILWGALGASFSQEWSILDQILIFVIFVSIISISFQSYSMLCFTFLAR